MAGEGAGIVYGLWVFRVTLVFCVCFIRVSPWCPFCFRLMFRVMVNSIMRCEFLIRVVCGLGE